MKVTLISEDRALHELFRDALLHARRFSWTLSAVANPTERPVADFCIWDVDSGTSVPVSADLNPSTCLFLVDQHELDRFRASFSGVPCNILLKPVTRATLAVFLDLISTITGSVTRGGPENSRIESLMQASLSMQKYDQERSAFLASLAHDLRAPATALLGYCGLLLDQSGGSIDERTKAILRQMQGSASRLSRMVSAIFDLSVELPSAQTLDLQAADVSLSVRLAWDEVALIAADKGISLDTRIEPNPHDLRFDPARLERVLINIFENSCRFTPVSGRIEVRGYPFFLERRTMKADIPTLTERRSSLARLPNSFRLDIRNPGPAIPHQHLERLFEQYVTLEPNRKRFGAGLGLAICRTIIAQHRGRIWAQNTELGPMFCIVLPAGTPEVLLPANRRGVNADISDDDPGKETNARAAI